MAHRGVLELALRATPAWVLLLAITFLAFLVVGCDQPTAPGDRADTFAVFGDMEPSPEPVFRGTELAVSAVTDLMTRRPGIDFVLGVGDIAHRGSDVQYERVAPVLRALPVTFFAIPGNEEYPDFDRFVREAQSWNDDPGSIPGARYVVRGNCFTVILAAASVDGREFADADIDWLVDQLDSVADRRAVLVTHGAAAGIFDVSGRKFIENPRFRDEVLSHSALALVISGDLHLDISSYQGVAASGGVLHVHAPGLERTKLGAHHARMRTVTTYCDGGIHVRTFDLEAWEYDAGLEWRSRAGDSSTTR